MFHFSEKCVWSTCFVSFLASATKGVCVWKTASFLSSCFPGYFCSFRSYMINVLAPPRGHHRMEFVYVFESVDHLTAYNIHEFFLNAQSS